MKYGNLHLHTVFSDGVLTPEELCAKAKEMGYGALAITDHHTVRGHARFAAAAEAEGLEYLLGIECTGNYGGHNHHIVGYGIDPTEPRMAKYLQENEDWSYMAMKAKVQAMQKAGTLADLTWQQVLDDAPNPCWICNEQIFASLIKRCGYTQADYYTRFIPAFRSANTGIRNTAGARSAEEMISTIRNAGGVASLAHPHGTTHCLPDLARFGLNCVEYDHPDIDESDTADALRYARELGLFVSGGTDHTGRLSNCPTQRGDPPGEQKLCSYAADVTCGVTKEEFDALKDACR